MGRVSFYTVCCVHKMTVSVAGSAAKRVGKTGHDGIIEHNIYSMISPSSKQIRDMTLKKTVLLKRLTKYCFGSVFIVLHYFLPEFGQSVFLMICFRPPS